MLGNYDERLKKLREAHESLLNRPNEVDASWNNGWYERFQYPVLTADHAPLTWRYDLNPETNPYLLERLGVNAAFNVGAMEFNGKIVLAARVEGFDRKSFIAIAESDNGIDNFRFWDKPCVIPETDNPETNVYDMRLTKHEDGWIYGVFCAERPSPDRQDLSEAEAQAGIVRTKDLVEWERLADLKSPSPQQRNVVLHPEFVDGKYAFYTRPQDSFISAGSGGGIGWGLSDSIENAEVKEEKVFNVRRYHTITESKNGQGPHPIKTPEGWLHIAHGVRGCASGLRYVLYVFMTALDDPSEVIYEPGGYFIAPRGEEYIGDVMNVAFCNGAVARDDGEVLIYYASSDTRTHVARTTIDRLVDYAKNTPPDPLNSYDCVQQRIALIEKNQAYLKKNV